MQQSVLAHTPNHFRFALIAWKLGKCFSCGGDLVAQNTQIQLQLQSQQQLLRPERAVYLRGETGRKLQLATTNCNLRVTHLTTQRRWSINCRSVPLWNEAIAVAQNSWKIFLEY